LNGNRRENLVYLAGPAAGMRALGTESAAKAGRRESRGKMAQTKLSQATRSAAKSRENAAEFRRLLVDTAGLEVRSYVAMDIRHTIGDNIRYGRRLADRMTQGELARRLEIPSRQLSDWERGVHRPSDANLRRIALALGQPFHWFFIERDSNGDPIPEAAAR
jgi:DNA-binding transcriptional regulator YiaG